MSQPTPADHKACFCRSANSNALPTSSTAFSRDSARFFPNTEIRSKRDETCVCLRGSNHAYAASTCDCSIMVLQQHSGRPANIPFSCFIIPHPIFATRFRESSLHESTPVWLAGTVPSASTPGSFFTTTGPSFPARFLPVLQGPVPQCLPLVCATQEQRTASCLGAFPAAVSR